MLDEEASNFATPTRSVMQPRKKLFCKKDYRAILLEMA
jgi:hypothetical protein